jgi:2-oxoisovalerate dehydrogenase E1 component
MAMIRCFETATATLYANGEIPGFVHLSIGQEAVAVGACFNLRDEDIITSTHRGHGHAIAKGLDIRGMFAELMGKQTGTCQGRGGSMHIADPEIGIFGANGIVAAGLPIAVGAAQALKMRNQDNVVLAFFGDGAVSQGAFHEAVNLASLWRLPIIFLCENNGFSEFSKTSDQHPVTLDKRAEAYGLPFQRVDGNDVMAVAEMVGSVIEGVRTGAGPHIVEAMTLRVRGHYEGDAQRYRSSNEATKAEAQDPLEQVKYSTIGIGVATEVWTEIDREVAELVAEAIDVARGDPEPEPLSLLNNVYATEIARAVNENAHSDTQPPLRYSKAISGALRDALGQDERVYLAGIDVGGGNVFGLTRGLSEAFPGRVLDTPISETAIVGLAVGSAMAGLRPVVEIMYLDFIGVCFDQIMNQVAKLRFMTGGRAKLPLVIRTQFGSGRSSGSQHSQSLEALLAHIPGLKVVMPATSRDAYGLLRSSIEDESPVVFIEHRLLYEREFPGYTADERIPLGRAQIVRPGTDATIVAWSRMVLDALEAAEVLALEGIDVEVIDLRTITPLDRTTVLESLGRTHRLLIAHDAVQDFGVGAELAAIAANEGFWSLDAPVLRVGATYSPAPYAPVLERQWLPSVESIIQGVRRQVNM